MGLLNSQVIGKKQIEKLGKKQAGKRLSRRKRQPATGRPVNFLRPLLIEFIHEWGNALNSHLMWIHVLKKHLTDGVDWQPTVMQVADSANRLVGLYEALRDGQAFKVRKKRLALLTLLQAVVARLEPQARRQGLALTLKASGELWIQADAEKLYRCLQNIVLNALEASPKKASVDLVLKAAKGWAEVSVHNFGKGILPRHRKKIFEPFFSTKKQDGTRGLGLFIARNIVLAHGGKISLRSRRRRGRPTTVVVIRLPA